MAANQGNQNLELFLKVLGQAGGGLANALRNQQANQSANDTLSSIQNTQNPPRASLVDPYPVAGDDPSQNIQDFQRATDNDVPVTGTAPYRATGGQAGLKNYLMMQQLQRQNSTSDMNTAYKQMQMERMGQQNQNSSDRLDIARQQLELAQQRQASTQANQQQRQSQIPAAVQSQMRQIVQANDISNKYLGVGLEQAAKYKDWQQDENDPMKMVSAQAAAELQHPVVIPTNEFHAYAPQLAAANASLKTLRQLGYKDQIDQLIQTAGKNINDQEIASQQQTDPDPDQQYLNQPVVAGAQGRQQSTPASSFINKYLGQ